MNRYLCISEYYNSDSIYWEVCACTKYESWVSILQFLVWVAMGHMFIPVHKHIQWYPLGVS